MTSAQYASQLGPTPTRADPIQTRTLVVSKSHETAKAVQVALSQDLSLHVTSKTASLSELVQVPPVNIREIDLIIFDIRVGNADDLFAIETLREFGHEGLKFLGVTGETLTLATSRDLMDAGVDEVIPLTSIAPVADPDPTDLALTAKNGPARRGDLHNGLIVATCGARGGVGATSFVLNLATQLARPAKSDMGSQPPKVVVVDLDIQNGVLAASLDLNDENDIVDWLQSGEAPEQDFIPRTVQTYAPAGFDVLGAPLAFVPLDILRTDMMAALLDDLRLSYDYVILDLPRTVCEWVEAVLLRADKFIILSDHSVHTLRQTRRLIDTFGDEHPDLPVDVVISKDQKSNTTSAALKEAETFLDRSLTLWVPRDDKSAKRAADAGQPLLLTRPRSKVGKAMMPIVQTLKDAQATKTRRRA